MPETLDYGEVTLALQQLEEALRRLNWWEEAPPSSAALASRQPFHADTLSFAQWLQWIFIPRIRALAETRGTLPGPCQITPMGEVAWREKPKQTQQLLEILTQLDRLLTAGQ